VRVRVRGGDVGSGDFRCPGETMQGPRASCSSHAKSRSLPSILWLRGCEIACSHQPPRRVRNSRWRETIRPPCFQACLDLGSQQRGFSALIRQSLGRIAWVRA
jgi:hypothetical protein